MRKQEVPILLHCGLINFYNSHWNLYMVQLWHNFLQWQPINDSNILFAIDSWNSGANCSMKVFAKGMNLIFLLRRENVNLIQYNIETTHAIQING